MKNIARLLVILTAILGLNLTSFAGSRLKEEGSGQKEFKPKGFNLLPQGGVRWAIMDDGTEIKVFYQKTNGYEILESVRTKEGLSIKTRNADGVISFINIEEGATGTRPQVSIIAADPAKMDELAKRFPTERPDK